MILYIFLFVISSVAAILDFSQIKKEKKFIIGVIFSSILIVLSGIRWQTGTDWNMYHSFFSLNSTFNEFVNNDIDNQGIEFGYGILNYIVKVIFDDYNVLLFFVAIIVIGLKCRWMYRYSPLPLVAIFVNLSIYLGDIFFVRQSLSIAISLIAFDFIIKKKKLSFCISVCLAATIHTSALIFLPAYMIYYLNLNLRKMIYITIAFLTISALKINTEIVLMIINNFPPETGKVIQKLHAYYFLNLQGENFGQAIDSNTRMIVAYFRRICFLPVFFVLYKKFYLNNEMYKGMLNLVTFAHILFFFLANLGMDFAGRISSYYYVYEILLITFIVNMKNKWKSKIFLFCIIYSYCFIKYIYLMYSLGEYYVPFNVFLKV